MIIDHKSIVQETHMNFLDFHSQIIKFCPLLLPDEKDSRIRSLLRKIFLKVQKQHESIAIEKLQEKGTKETPKNTVMWIVWLESLINGEFES